LRRLLLDGVLDEDPALLAPRHRALDEDETLLGVGRDDLEALRRHPLGPEMARHLLSLKGLAGVLPLPGRPEAAVRDRDAVRGAETGKIVPLHPAGKTLADARAGDIDKLAGDKMRRGDL